MLEREVIIILMSIFRSNDSEQYSPASPESSLSPRPLVRWLSFKLGWSWSLCCSEMRITSINLQNRWKRQLPTSQTIPNCLQFFLHVHKDNGDDQQSYPPLIQTWWCRRKKRLSRWKTSCHRSPRQARRPTRLAVAPCPWPSPCRWLSDYKRRRRQHHRLHHHQR